jgi:hypothetical protein
MNIASTLGCKLLKHFHASRIYTKCAVAACYQLHTLAFVMIHEPQGHALSMALYELYK